jgi:hypothetical protein
VPDLDVYKPFLRLMTSRWPLWVVERLFIGYRTFEAALRTPWSSGRYDKSGFDVDHYHKIRKVTDRTARIAGNTAICRIFCGRY